MKKFISLLVLAAMIMMLLAGCGSGSSETPAPASTPESSAEGGGGDAQCQDNGQKQSSDLFHFSVSPLVFDQMFRIITENRIKTGLIIPLFNISVN